MNSKKQYVGNILVSEANGFLYMANCRQCKGSGRIYTNYLDPPEQCECYVLVSYEEQRIEEERAKIPAVMFNGNELFNGGQKNDRQ